MLLLLLLLHLLLLVVLLLLQKTLVFLVQLRQFALGWHQHPNACSSRSLCCMQWRPCDVCSCCMSPCLRR